MKKLITFFIILLIFIILGVTFAMRKEASLHDHIEFEEIQYENLSDGIFTGNYETLFIKVELEVTIENQIIKAIEIIKHDNGKGQAAEAITYDIIDLQDVNVDTISSATYSSQVIKKAVENALLKSLEE